MTLMHFSSVVPGLAFETWYRCESRSLSVMCTVPASKLLPAFAVLLENAAYVPMPASAPSAPTTSSV
ncbi:MAG: hypothetical protein M3245_01615 [Actinomycetota bacterium]|nr:hypothetical protein [Actinomycetota bacterium]